MKFTPIQFIKQLTFLEILAIILLPVFGVLNLFLTAFVIKLILDIL